MVWPVLVDDDDDCKLLDLGVPLPCGVFWSPAYDDPSELDGLFAWLLMFDPGVIWPTDVLFCDPSGSA